MKLSFATSLGAPLGDRHRRLRGWYERMLARPSVAAEVAGMLAAQQALSA